MPAATPSAPTRSVLSTLAVGTAALLLSVAAAVPALAAGDEDGDDAGLSHSHATEHRSHPTPAPATHEPADGDPAGNNGTVKIHDDSSDPGHHNQPHVDCDFTVDFWGFDADQTLTVSFAGQAPTGAGTPLPVTGAPTTITSTTSAGGGNDFDGELAFTADQLGVDTLGEPHPQQGYHVKLTVATGAPGGAKYKVFWIEPCATSVAGSSTTAEASTLLMSRAQAGTTTAGGSGTQSSGGAVLDNLGSATAGAPAEVLAERVVRTPERSTTAALPFTGAQIGGLLAAAGIVLAAGAGLLVAGRRRRAVSSTS